MKNLGNLVLHIVTIVLASLLFLGTAQASPNPLTPGFQEEVSVITGGIETAVNTTFAKGENLIDNAVKIDGDNYLENDTAGNSEVLLPEKVEGFYAVVPLKTLFIYNSTEVERASYLFEL